MYLQRMWKEKISSLIEIVKSMELLETNQLELKRMIYMPDDFVLFLTRSESDDLLEEFEEIGVYPIEDLNLYVVFDENEIVSYKGKQYITGPVVIRSGLDPESETDLTKDEIRAVLDHLEAKETILPLSWKDVPALAL